jgi:hypothetical protein
MSKNYRYVITVDRNDEPGNRVLKQGHRRRADADHAQMLLIENARKEFLVKGELSRIDTPSDRRMGILDAIIVGPVTIILRRRTSSDNDTDIILPPAPSKIREYIITGGITAIFWGAIFIYAGVEYGYKSLIGFITSIIGFFAAIFAVAATLALAARGVSALRNRLMATERGSHVEYISRRGLFYLYVVLITPLFVLISIFFVVVVLAQFGAILMIPLELVAAIGRGIGIW